MLKEYDQLKVNEEKFSYRSKNSNKVGSQRSHQSNPNKFIDTNINENGNGDQANYQQEIEVIEYKVEEKEELFENKSSIKEVTEENGEKMIQEANEENNVEEGLNKIEAIDVEDKKEEVEDGISKEEVEAGISNEEVRDVNGEELKAEVNDT